MPSAAVLAGGAGSRLGGAKPAALLDGRPLIEHVLEAARAGGLEPMVVAKAGSPLPPLQCRVLLEPELPHHPLCGIVAALRELPAAEALVVCACDMPFVTGELLAWIARRPAPLAVAATASGVHPLLGRYAASLLPALEAALTAPSPMRALVRELGAELLDESELAPFGDPERLCRNVNTPAELAAASK